MNKLKKFFWSLLFPKTIIIFLLVNISAVLLIYAFCSKDGHLIVAYVSYVLSAYALTVVCARMPGIIKRIKARIYANKYANRFLTDRSLRIRMSLYGGLIFNSCFAVFKVIVGIVYNSAWLFAMAGYNMILSIMRYILVRRDMADRHKESEDSRLRGLKSYKVCGFLMLLLNVAISVIVMMVVFDDHAISYPGFMIYAIAAYTFICLSMAIVNLVRYRHRHNPVFSAVKRIEMAKAIVSIFTLQVALLTQFGSNSVMVNRMANGATGFVACTIITVMAVFMLIGVKKDYKEMR